MHRSSQPLDSSASSMSKFHTSLARIRRISAYARLCLELASQATNMFSVAITYFLPMQFRGPTEKACIASFLSFAKAGSPSQRSGMNSSGRVQHEGSWQMGHCHTSALVCGIGTSENSPFGLQDCRAPLESQGKHCTYAGGNVLAEDDISPFGNHPWLPARHGRVHAERLVEHS